MKKRCSDKTLESYKNYGGRGIVVCKEWKNSFEVFRDWAIENGYSKELTIDRENNDGNYEPSNCRWTNRNIQARNTKKIKSNNTSGYRGVHFKKSLKKWQSTIVINKKHIH